MSKIFMENTKNKQDSARTHVLHVELCSVDQSKLSQRALRIMISVTHVPRNDFRIFESMYSRSTLSTRLYVRLYIHTEHTVKNYVLIFQYFMKYVFWRKR